MKSFVTFLLFITSLFISLQAQAEKLVLLTEDDPPYSILVPNGNPTGYGVDVVNEIQKRLGTSEIINVWPWARVMVTIKSEPNIVAFTMSRTIERDKMFQWVGPVIENNWVFVAKKNSGIVIRSLDDAKKIKTIGVVRDYAWDKYLMEQGFTNLDRVKDHSTNLKKLTADRIQLTVLADTAFVSTIKNEGLDPKDFEIVHSFNTVQMYIAHSIDTDKELVAKWQLAFNNMKKDGTVAALIKKWLPTAKFPGIAKIPNN